MNVSWETAKRFLEGEEGAFSEVYHAYRPILFFIISNYVSGKEDREARGSRKRGEPLCRRSP